MCGLYFQFNIQHYLGMFCIVKFQNEIVSF